ncbi:hypothetical protein BKA82DRAFT_920211 [Pisolithus tinctorius]|uniref:Uncharacterized protein n=1 Tax=Pisolithus tinctorius Marx 270 TaxID=870435 RepID=A0A0C3NNZ8_PISTI|nr:hypothetical protein BKA82DRAFT_920211 [Pisolithus tinctorius]KIN97043.1 hypothetical protein M404DRAFT_920211 [Pisolithus tinctorius Marx 270]
MFCLHTTSIWLSIANQLLSAGGATWLVVFCLRSTLKYLQASRKCPLTVELVSRLLVSKKKRALHLVFLGLYSFILLGIPHICILQESLIGR